jgi:3-deoxy-D-manno-octulosonate 8-phosphate phosphatase (KDO 8-P phosphatase)
MVRLLVLDVDGVMTDGRILYSSSGEELKVFDVRDGHGIKLWHRAGLKTAIITGRASTVVERRAAELGIEHVYQKSLIKLEALDDLLEKVHLSPMHVSYMGDDLVDIPVMRKIGLPIAPASAIPEVREVAYHVTEHSGGHGAVRDAIEFILKAQNRWQDVTGRYFT